MPQCVMAVKHSGSLVRSKSVMKLCEKTFLLLVGLITTAFDEVSDAIEEAIDSVEEQRQKIDKRLE
jgi:hypothetical protein